MAGGLFTSELSVSGFALCDVSGVTPIRQVMGTCVFLLGRPSITPYERLYGAVGSRRRLRAGAYGVELTGVTAGFNDARAHALDRLRSEASACGAHAVLDLRVVRRHLDLPAACIEYLITGTAVRLRESPPPAEPALIALGPDDYWKLVQAGYAPVDVASASVVYQTRPSMENARALAGLRYRQGRANRELPEFSATVSGVLDIALARLGASARMRPCSHIVGLRMERRLEAIHEDNAGRMPMSGEPVRRTHLRVTMHLLGTTIREQRRSTRERTERGTWREATGLGRSRGATIEPVVNLAYGRSIGSQREDIAARIEEGVRDPRRED